MTEPCTDVLDLACDWASGSTTAVNSTYKLVIGLYNETNFLYDNVQGRSRYSGSTTTPFDLTTMISEIGDDDIIVNCYDMGKSVNIISNSIGCNSTYNFCSSFGILNCIKPIGLSWTNNPFYIHLSAPYNVSIVDGDYENRTGFYNHAFCMVNGYIYDACMKVDTDSNPDTSPHIESWATGWNWTNYKNKVIDDYPISSLSYPTVYDYIVY